MVLEFTDRGMYCPAGDFYIDPVAPVDRALITHAHADHARKGHAHYLSSDRTHPMLEHRLGKISSETVPYGTNLQIGGARVSFHPAGHVPGSAQIRVEVNGQVWVAAGDYKVVDDGVSEAFEPVKCHAFVTESTFGLPVFKWTPDVALKAEINAWWAKNAKSKKNSLIGAYSLGKAQRVLAALDPSIGPIVAHPTVAETNKVLEAQGVILPKTEVSVETKGKSGIKGAMIVAPPSAMDSAWARQFTPLETAFASGWMAVRGIRRRRSIARGFVMSDHADWDGLNTAIKETSAEKVFVTHGYTDVFSRWLREQGFDAHDIDAPASKSLSEAPTNGI